MVVQLLTEICVNFTYRCTRTIDLKSAAYSAELIFLGFTYHITAAHLEQVSEFTRDCKKKIGIYTLLKMVVLPQPVFPMINNLNLVRACGAAAVAAINNLFNSFSSAASRGGADWDSMSCSMSLAPVLNRSLNKLNPFEGLTGFRRGRSASRVAI